MHPSDFGSHWLGKIIHRLLPPVCAFAGLALLAASRAQAEEAAPAALESVYFVKAWGGLGAEPGQFNMPIGVAVNARDEIFVTDHYNDRIQKFDAEGKLLGCYPVLPNPSGIGISGDGLLYVTHFAATKPDVDKGAAGECLAVYDGDGKLLRQWGRHGTGDGEFNCPGGVAVGKDGRVYVADQTNHRIQVFDAMGKLLLKWGEYGNEPGQFGGKDAVYARTGGPQFVALDAQGNVWTTEGMNCRVQQFSPEGKFLAAWGDSEDKPGSFGGFFAWADGKKGRLRGPIALCFDRQDNLWVSAVSGRVQQFTREGKYLQGIGEGQGAAPGQFNIPHGIAFDSKGSLYVADALNHRVQKFATAR